MNSFEVLNLPADLTLSEEEIKSAYDQSGREEKHLQARNTLLSQASMLEEWMSSQNLTKERHAPIPSNLIPLFSGISDCVNSIGQLSERRRNAATTLAQSLLDKQLLEKKPDLDALSGELFTIKSALSTALPLLQQSPSPDKANELLQSLKFIQKWESELNKAYSNLL